MELFKNPENLSIISMKYLYQYCVNNIPRVREILVPLTDETIIAMSDYVWEQVWDIFDADSFSILPIICQRGFSLESLDTILERRHNFSNKTLQQICVLSATRIGGYLKRKELKEYFERFPNCFWYYLKSHYPKHSWKKVLNSLIDKRETAPYLR